MELKAKNLSDNEIGDMVLENSKKLADDKYSSSVFMRGTDIQKDKIKGEDVLRAFRMKTYRSYGIGIFDMARNHSSRIYDIDEEKYIRRLDMVLK